MKYFSSATIKLCLVAALIVGGCDSATTPADKTDSQEDPPTSLVVTTKSGESRTLVAKASSVLGQNPRTLRFSDASGFYLVFEGADPSITEGAALFYAPGTLPAAGDHQIGSANEFNAHYWSEDSGVYRWYNDGAGSASIDHSSNDRLAGSFEFDVKDYSEVTIADTSTVTSGTELITLKGVFDFEPMLSDAMFDDSTDTGDGSPTDSTDTDGGDGDDGDGDNGGEGEGQNFVSERYGYQYWVFYDSTSTGLTGPRLEDGILRAAVEYGGCQESSFELRTELSEDSAVIRFYHHYAVAASDCFAIQYRDLEFQVSEEILARTNIFFDDPWSDSMFRLK